MNQPVVSFEKVSVRYADDSILFSSLDLSLKSGEFYYLTGPSGSGKSTFLKLLYMAIYPFEGRLQILGEDVRGATQGQKARLRQEMGIVFQDFKLLDHLTVVENVALALRIRGLEGPKSEAQGRELLNWVGVEGVERSPSSLSGGEKQRVAIARAVITRPRILIADEPTGSVDDETALKIFYLFEELHKIGTTVIVATHNRDLVTAFPHVTLTLDGGRVITEQERSMSQAGWSAFPHVA